MTRFRWIPWALALALFGLLSFQHRHDSKLKDRIAVREQQIAVLTKHGDSLAVLLDSLSAHADTLYETRWLPSKLRIDTLADTVKVPVEVVREVVRDADETIQACRVTVSECTKLAQTEKARADSLTEQVKDYKRLSRGPLVAFNGYAATDLRQHYYAGAEARVNVWTLHAFGRVESRVDSIAPQYRVGVTIPF